MELRCTKFIIVALYFSYQSTYSQDEFPVTLNLRQQLYFESQVQTEDSRLSILALECYATPSQDRTAQPRYNLIENGLEFNFFQICEQFLLKKRDKPITIDH